MDTTDEFDVCQKCGAEYVHVNEHRLPMCSECREELLNKPISKKVTIALVVILILSLATLYRLPIALKSAIAYEQGIAALHEARVYTALNQLSAANKIYHDSEKINAALYEAQYRAGEYEAAGANLEQLIKNNPKPDKYLADQVNGITDKLSIYYSTSEPFSNLIKELDGADQATYVEGLQSYLETYPEDLNANYILCEYYYTNQEYEKIEAQLEPLLDKYPEWLLGYDTMIPTKRELGKKEDARRYYSDMIGLNVENHYSYLIAAKAELRFKSYDQALELAQKAFELSPENSYVHGMLAMANHASGNADESKRFLELFDSAKDTDEETRDFIHAYIKDESDWR